MRVFRIGTLFPQIFIWPQAVS